MNEASHPLDPAAVRSDIHGELVGRPDGVFCDFCESPIPIDEPVQYDVIRRSELDGLDMLVALPDEWMPDAARCRACAIDAISPETDGWEEALVTVAVSEVNGVCSLEASSLTVVDHSPGDAGEHPPLVPLSALADGGMSLFRWAYVKSMLDNHDVDLPIFDVYREILAGFERAEA